MPEPEIVETTRVVSSDLKRMIQERDELRAHVAALQADGSRAAEASLARSVRAFHLTFGHPIATTPAVPSDAQVRFRLRLIAEEFFELLFSANDGTFFPRDDIDFHVDIPEMVNEFINEHCGAEELDLPEFVDALADLDYVVEGTRAVFGVHGAPIAAEVQRSNMAKDPNGPDGKPVKPADWTPPDIRGCLISQGWKA